ncbi:MAG: deoxyribodipyrimidine photo-lyase [Proteobacteria bacterium]|nr:deoxyribodipyrimidine photo-lyase [Pseudomonadota bacterium]
MHTPLVWFRRDLRLHDHPALTAALEGGGRVIALYIHAPEEEAPWSPGAASHWWLHHSLAALDAELRLRGAQLVIARGPSLATLQSMAQATGATSVHWNRTYEPALIARDATIKSALRAAVLQGTVKNGSGDPFRVFTPFWRVCQGRLSEVGPPLPAPAKIRAARPPAGIALAALELLPQRRWDSGFAALWSPGEQGAHARLKEFLEDDAADYAEMRDRPDMAGTSRLAAHLHFGEISPRQVLAISAATLERDGARRGTESFLREVGWREFGHHLLYAFPHTTDQPMDVRYTHFQWRPDAALLRAWQRGQTGIPLVDAGMRELWHTGWMHNRVRMVAASFLIKNLQQPWLDGARWFHDTLVDADLASNTAGWQWTAGCGADAAPFYRIFNPVLQSERFDPARGYLRRWLPELARLPAEWLHRPFLAPAAVLAAAGVRLGQDYPVPLVDLAGSRDRALAAWQQIRTPAEAQPAPAARRRPTRR